MTDELQFNYIKIATKLLLSILFLCCLLDMPYGYYQFIRVLGLTGFIILAYFDSKKENKVLMIIWICSAILINPLIKIPLGRTIWNVVDVIWAVFLVITLINDILVWKKENKS